MLFGSISGRTVLILLDKLLFLAQKHVSTHNTKYPCRKIVTKCKAMAGIREIVEVTQKELHEIVGERGAIRVGATVDPDRRANGYESDGYAGTMYVAKTENMMKAEDRLLKEARKTGGGRHNVQDLSNAAEDPGYVYVIKGRRYD